jgi:hypothetical protein
MAFAGEVWIGKAVQCLPASQAATANWASCCASAPCLLVAAYTALAVYTCCLQCSPSYAPACCCDAVYGAAAARSLQATQKADFLPMLGKGKGKGAQAVSAWSG